jgi:general secretion pathway protein D
MSAGLFTLQHTEVETILDELEQILGVSKDGPLAGVFRLIPLERLNAVLVITPQSAYLKKAKTWIARLDKLAPDGLGGEGVYVYKVANVVATELADTLNDIFSGKKKSNTKKASLAPGSRAGKVTSKNKRSQPNNRRVNAADISDVRIIPDEVNNALIITASPSEYEAIKGVIKQLDVVPLQVLIDAMIIEVTLGDALKYGVEWSGRWGTNFINATAGTPAVPGTPRVVNSDGSITPAVPAVPAVPPRAEVPATTEVEIGQRTGAFDSIAGVASALSTYGIFHGFEIQAKLNALASNDVLNVVSTPSLLVLNNQEAFINVGDRVPIPTSQATNTNSTSNAGTVITNQIQYQETGVTLKVTPRVNPGGLVIMEIEQTSDTAVPTTTSNLNAPTIRQRKITSTLAVQHGDTIALGGLIQETRTGGTSGIPILRNLPLIGPLFGVTSKTLSRTELIVLLTPRVVENRQDAREVTRELQRKLTGVFEERMPNSDMLMERSELLDHVSEGL